jgi:hypothetical protein
MRRPRLKIQRLMVVVVFAAILSWGVPTTVNEWKRRYHNCQDQEAYHGKKAAEIAIWVNGLADQDAQYARLKQRLDFHSSKQKEYRRAVFRPWELWSLGN